jgi:hypothetical protein
VDLGVVGGGVVIRRYRAFIEQHPGILSVQSDQEGIVLG